MRGGGAVHSPAVSSTDSGVPSDATESAETLKRVAAESRETAALLARELAAMEDDLRSLERHVAHLEHGRLVLEIEIGQLRARAAELFADLERDEAMIVELRRALAATENPAGETHPPRRARARSPRRGAGR